MLLQQAHIDCGHASAHDGIARQTLYFLSIYLVIFNIRNLEQNSMRHQVFLYRGSFCSS